MSARPRSLAKSRSGWSAPAKFASGADRRGGRAMVGSAVGARISADAVTVGSVGRTSSLTLHHGGCGGWTVANVEHELSLRNSGSGRIDAGSAGSADIVLSGSGEMRVGAVKNALAARVS